MDERKAIELCVKHHDPFGFEQLVRMFRREAYMHAVAMLGNEQDAADACQDSFARAFAALPKLKTLDRFYPWFYTILRNCCLNVLARRKTAANYRAQEEHAARGAYDDSSPHLLLERAEDQDMVWRTLTDLSPNDREILVLKYIQGRRYDEIAQLLGIARGTVMSRLFYARQAFRETFEKMKAPPSKEITHEH